MLTLNPTGKIVAQCNGGKLHDGKFVSVCDDTSATGFETIADPQARFEIVPTVNYIPGKKRKLEPVRDVVFVCGPSGMGKSTVLAAYARKFQRMFKKCPIFMISRKQDDPAYANVKLCKPILDETLVDDPIDIQSDDVPANCLFIFDDYDTFPDPIQQCINKLLADILETGRAKNIYCAISSHLMSKQNRTDNARLYNEMHRLIVSPRGGNRPALVNVLENHMGLDKRRIAEILRKDSRWLVFGKQFPQYLILDHGMTIL